MQHFPGALGDLSFDAERGWILRIQTSSRKLFEHDFKKSSARPVQPFGLRQSHVPVPTPFDTCREVPVQKSNCSDPMNPTPQESRGVPFFENNSGGGQCSYEYVSPVRHSGARHMLGGSTLSFTDSCSSPATPASGTLHPLGDIATHNWVYAWIDDMQNYLLDPSLPFVSKLTSTPGRFEVQLKSGGICWGAPACVLNSFFGPFRMELAVDHMVDRDFRLLAHEYGHVAQHVGGFLNGTHYLLNNQVRAGLEGWADAWASSYHLYRGENSPRAFDEISIDVNASVIRRDQAIEPLPFFGILAPEPDQQNRTVANRRARTVYMGEEIWPCPNNNHYVCGAVIARLFWFVYHNTFPYGSPRLGGVSRGDPVFLATPPDSRGMLVAPMGHGQSLKDILANMVAFLDVNTASSDKPRLVELLRQLCIDDSGSGRPECRSRARMPFVRVPWGSAETTRFVDGVQETEDWTGPANLGATDLTRTFTGLEELFPASSFNTVSNAFRQTAFVDAGRTLERIDMNGPGARIEMPISLPGGFGAPPGPLRWQLRIGSGIYIPPSPGGGPTNSLANSDIPELEVSLVQGGTVVDTVSRAAPVNWWNIRPNRHYQADRVFRAWDPVNPGLELVAPPGNYILRVDVPKGSMQFFAVVIRRDGSPNPGCPSNQDGDNFCDAQDNCPSVPNNDQRNQDGDSYGNFCDVCLTSSVNDTGDPASDNESNLWPDSDQDSVCDAVDNCPLQSNPRQWDNDGDGSGDACDNDDDNDQVVDSLDLCSRVASPVPGQNHVDQDGDGVGDECDVERTACYQSQCPSDGLCDYDPTTCLPRKPFTEAQAFVNRLSRALEHLDFDLIEGIPWDSFVGCVTPNCTLPTQVEVETLAAEVVEGREVPVTSWDDFQAVVELEAEKNAGFDLWDGELGGYLNLLYESQGSFLYR